MEKKGNLIIKKGILILMVIAILIALPLGLKKVKAADVLDNAKTIGLNDKVTCKAEPKNDVYYTFTVEKQGVVNFNVKFEQKEISFSLYDSKNKNISYYSSLSYHAVEGRSSSTDHILHEWNTVTQKGEFDIAWELEPGIYYICLSAKTDLGNKKIAVETTYFETDSRDTIKLDDEIILQVSEHNPKELRFTVTEKGIMAINVNTLQSKNHFYLYDSYGNEITDLRSDLVINVGKLRYDYKKWLWLQDSDKKAKIDYTLTYELIPGDYRIKISGSANPLKSETTVTTNFKSTEPKTTKEILLQLEMTKGSTARLNALLTPSDSTSKVTWKTSKKSVCTVSSNGKVKAVGKGKCTITVTSNGQKVKLSIKVK